MIPLRLESFDETEVIVTDAVAQEEMCRAAQAAGRAEAEAEHAASDARAAQDLAETVARSLQDLAFTWAGAQDLVVAQVGPVLRQMLAALLPQVAVRALAPVVEAEVLPLLREAAADPLRVVLHPDDLAAVEAHLAPASGLVVQADPATPAGTARILRADTERVVDPAAAVARMLAAMDDLFTLNHERLHG